MGLMHPASAAERLIVLRDRAPDDQAAPRWDSDREALAMGANALAAVDDFVTAWKAMRDDTNPTTTARATRAVRALLDVAQ